MKITKTNTKVLFWADSGIKSYSQECNVFAHPRKENFIIISEEGTPQEVAKSTPFDYREFKNHADTSFNAASRDAMIEILVKVYFNTAYVKNASRFLDTLGNGTGSVIFTGDYSLTATKAIIKPSSNRSLFINRLLFYIEASQEINSDVYGANIILTNGIDVVLEKQTGDLVNTFTQLPIFTNSDFAKYGFRISDIVFKNGQKHVSAILDNAQIGGNIEIKHDEQLAIILNDDYSSLIHHEFRAGAYYLE